MRTPGASPDPVPPVGPRDACRWTWRTFPPSLAPIRARLGALGARPAPPRTAEGAETCVLSERSPQCAWIREAGLELDLLCRREPGGLECWSRLAPLPFPLEAVHLPRVFETWGIPLPALRRDTYTCEQFLGELVHDTPGLAAVDLRPHRESHTLAEVHCELARLELGDRVLDTLALEHGNPGPLRQALARLGFEGLPNTSLARGLASGTRDQDSPATSPRTAPNPSISRR